MKKMTEAEREKYRTQLLVQLAQHVGSSRTIGMGELYQAVFGEPWRHRINDTRRLRTIITELRRDGIPIVSMSSSAGGGYYLASAGSELNGYCQRLRNQALKKLAMEARLRKMTLPDLMGQMILEVTSDE